jgi:hypothetical protein
VLTLKQNSRKKIIIDLIFIFIQTACTIGLFLTEKFYFMRIAIGDLIFWLIYMIVETKRKWKIPLYIRIVVILSILSNDGLGELLNLYVTSVLFDRVQHIFGTYSFTLWAFFIFQQFIQIKITQKKFIFILFICLSSALGTLYEIFEFFQDTFFKPPVKNQPSLTDTNLDLISDIIGGIIAFFHYSFSKKLKLFKFPFEKKFTEEGKGGH